MTENNAEFQQIVQRFQSGLLEPLKSMFVGKDEVIDVLGIGLIGRENVFLYGPPGTAKSAIVQALARLVDGQMFDYLLTRFTEPNELFGPFDIRRLREGELITNTEGMFPEATLVFLDELLNANSAILNSLLMALNERVFRRGREFRKLPTLMVVGASNHLPEDTALAALFDRFLLRVTCDNVPFEQLGAVLDAGWRLDAAGQETATDRIRIEELEQLQQATFDVDLTPIQQVYIELIHRFRHAGFSVSDRRAVKFQRLIAASAIQCGRQVAHRSDLWVLRYTWDNEEQQEVLASLVDDVINTEVNEAVAIHPRSRPRDQVDPELLARDVENLQERWERNPSPRDLAYLKDQLGLISERLQWVENDTSRQHLQERISELWQQLTTTSESAVG